MWVPANLAWLIINATGAGGSQGARGVGTHRGKQEVQVGRGLGEGGPETKQAARGGSVIEARNESEKEDLSVVARGMRTVEQMAMCAREAVWQANSAYPIVRARTGAAACDDAPGPDKEQRVSPRDGARWAVAKHARDCASVCVCRLVTKVRE